MRLVEFRVAVFVVARERIAGMRRVHADLVRAAGLAAPPRPASRFLPKNCTGLNTLAASLPEACAFTVRSPPTRMSVRSGTSMRFLPSSHLPFTSAR